LNNNEFLVSVSRRQVSRFRFFTKPFFYKEKTGTKQGETTRKPPEPNRAAARSKRGFLRPRREKKERKEAM
jgi:hypothetical protein